MEVVTSKEFKNLIAAISKLTDEVTIKKLANRLARMYKALLVANIKSNKYEFTLAMRTIMHHTRMGVDDTPLIVTGEYVNSIYVYGGKVTVAKGYHSSGLSYSQLSFILEFGRLDKSIPARPIWTMTLRDFIPTATKIANRILAKSIKDAASA